MSIQPPSDIVLDVANAADPAKAIAAADRLARLAAGAPATTGTFAVALGAAGQGDAVLRSRMAANAPTADTIAKPLDPRAKAFKGLEALVLQNLVETMLPKDAGSFFGESAGGNMWRSMLAQKIGEQLSTRMDLGLASKAAAVHDAPPAAMPAMPDGLALEAARAAAGGARG